MSQFARLYWIDTEIRSGRFPNAPQVSLCFGISERTAAADFSSLRRDFHAPLVYRAQQRGYTYDPPGYVLPRLILTERELAALRRALLAAQEFGGIAGDTEALALLTTQLTEIKTPDRGRVSIEGGAQLAPDSLTSSELFEACRMAINRRQRLALHYSGAHRGTDSERTVQPLHLHRHLGEWYLIAHCELAAGIRNFHLSRVRNWLVFADTAAFLTPSEFDAAAYVRQAFGMRHGEPLVTVRVRFTPYQSRWIRERIYHPSQTLEELPEGGGVVLTMQVTGTFEVRRWVMSFGSEAEVLEPEALREEIREELKKLGKIYGFLLP
ncbi:helix-turn-helix transcriptional regulator [Armatimonas sp.]|uniref:helix-turn-helix transcriptional regulator n=1 Tax=Armatimonas sp. TaxID=1872638 RepID=UPI0037532E50